MMELSKTSVTPRVPGPLQIGIILFTVCLSVLVTAVLGPSLPKMEAYFSEVEIAPQLVPLAMTVPMLMMALFSMIAGGISDRFGRKNILIVGCLAYGVLGILPLYLDDLYAIVISRVALGIAEAFIVVIGIALISDFFDGQKRARILALQTTTAAISAVFLNYLGGVLGDVSWRAPYAIYGIGLVLALLAALFLWEPPKRSAKDDTVATFGDDEEAAPVEASIDWGTVAFMTVVVSFGGLVFLTIPVNLGFLFDAIGEESSAKIGIAYSLNSLAIVIGSFIFGWGMSGRFSTALQYFIAAFLVAVGFLGLWLAQTYIVMTIWAIVSGLGAGMLLPTLVVWGTGLFPKSKVGLGSGIYNSSVNFGNFLSGIVVILLAGWLGSRAEVFMLFAVILLAQCVIALILMMRKSSSSP